MGQTIFSCSFVAIESQTPGPVFLLIPLPELFPEILAGLSPPGPFTPDPELLPELPGPFTPDPELLPELPGPLSPDPELLPELPGPFTPDPELLPELPGPLSP